MKLNKEETDMLYDIIWSVMHGFVDADSLITDYTTEQFKSLCERILDETDLGWASEGELTFTC